MANQYTNVQEPQAVGLAGMSVSPDLAADVRGKYGPFISKIGDQLVYGESTPGHSISKLIAVPNSPTWITFMLGTRGRQQASTAGVDTTGMTPAQRGARTRNRNRSRVPAGAGG